MRPEDVGIGRLFDSVRDAVILADAETQQIRLWNAAAADMFGYSTSEALDLRIESLIPNRLKARHREGIARYAATGHGTYVDSHSLLELPALTKSGEEISIELSLSPMHNIPGVDRRRFVLAIIRDVTNRKQAEEEIRQLNEDLENRILERTRQLETALTQRKRIESKLREAEARARRVIEQIPAITYIQEVGYSSITTYVSPQMKTLLGYEPEECISDPDHWTKILHPDDRERVLAEDRRTNETGEPFKMEYRQFAKDGSVVWIRDEAALVRDDEGNSSYWLGVQIDVTERKQAEQELHKSEARFRTLIQNSADVIATVNADGKVVYESDSVERVLGYKPEELIGADGFHLLHPDDLPKAQNLFAELVSIPGATSSAELWAQHRDGSWRYLAITGTNLLHKPSIASIVVNYRDITERKKAEEEIKEANRRLEELAVLRADFTAMVAHELDTPLAVIRGYAEMLATDALEPAEQSRVVDKILAEAEVLRGLVADVRDAAAFEREDFAIEPQPVLVRALLDEADQGGAVLLGNHPLVIENAVDDEQVWADPNRIRQVLRNLLSNAAKYSPDNAPIELRAKPAQTPGRIRIEVTDYGYGIHPDDVQRVFEKFGRGRDRYGRKRAGVGLGLYLSRRIMRAHGSDLNISSVPNGGSEFSFDLEAVR